MSDKRDGIPVDARIAAAARALAGGDPLGALKRIALRDDARALALRGIAMAQLGDLVRAKVLLKSAARAFGPGEALARARCVVADAEIALVLRDHGRPSVELDAARATLEEHGDRVNAAFARYLEARRLLLIGRVDEAERALAPLDPAALPPASRAAYELVVAGIALRRPRTKAARAASRPRRAAELRGSPPPGGSGARGAPPDAPRRSESRAATSSLSRGRGRCALQRVVVDARARRARAPIRRARPRRLFALARALGEAWPGDVSRDALVARVFDSKFVDASHRARLRVEMGRLRAALRRLAVVSATKRGFALSPRNARDVVVLARPVEEEHAHVLALLATGRGQLGARARARHEPAHRAARARPARGRGQGAVVRPRAGAAVADAPRAGIRDDLVAPRVPAHELKCRHATIPRRNRA